MINSFYGNCKSTKQENYHFILLDVINWHTDGFGIYYLFHPKEKTYLISYDNYYSFKM
jgi:hypothetical protein